jgi:hypothetical protein
MLDNYIRPATLMEGKQDYQGQYDLIRLHGRKFLSGVLSTNA